MKKRFIFLVVICTLLLTILPACDIKNAGSLKSITNPHIAQYECVEATLGENNLMEKFDYIKITLVDKENLELNYKQKDGESKTLKSKYTFDVQTHTLTAEIGLLGYSFRQSTVIEKGKFTITKPIGGKQLIMKFKAN